MQKKPIEFILPHWPVSQRIRALTTTRLGGVSMGPYASFNLAVHVGDDPQAVAENRQQLHHRLNLPRSPFWLSQIHSTVVHSAYQSTEPADASFTHQAGAVLAIMTGDCLPILLVNSQEQKLAAVHGGWRGLAAGILTKTLAHAFTAEDEIIAWLGPAIGPQAFEVGSEVQAIFTDLSPKLAEHFKPSGNKYFADIYAIARTLLNNLGVTQIYGGEYCTVSDAELFFSYRRDGMTGRMATLLWRE